MEISQNKVFERPTGGSYIGTIIDVVDMPQQMTKFGPKDKIRIMWVLAYANGAPYMDSEGKPFLQAGFYNATMSDNSNLTKAVRQILNALPPVVNNTEELARLLIGRSNSVFLTQEPDTKNKDQFVTFVAGISPLPPGVVPPQAPAGFLRHKDKPKQASGPNPGQTSQTYQQRPPNVNLNAGAPPAPQVGGTSNDAF
jgi:hypothetical protein